MTKKRVTKKPKVVWVGSTPITPITPKERNKLHRLMKKRLEMRLRGIPKSAVRLRITSANLSTTGHFA
jgi:hypothetical protein